MQILTRPSPLSRSKRHIVGQHPALAGLGPGHSRAVVSGSIRGDNLQEEALDTDRRYLKCTHTLGPTVPPSGPKSARLERAAPGGSPQPGGGVGGGGKETKAGQVAHWGWAGCQSRASRRRGPTAGGLAGTKTTPRARRSQETTALGRPFIHATCSAPDAPPGPGGTGVEKTHSPPSW